MLTWLRRRGCDNIKIERREVGVVGQKLKFIVRISAGGHPGSRVGRRVFACVHAGMKIGENVDASNLVTWKTCGRSDPAARQCDWCETHKL